MAPTSEDMARDARADLAVLRRNLRPDGETDTTRHLENAILAVLALVALPAWVRRAESGERNAAHFALKYNAALGRLHAAEGRAVAAEARVANLEALVASVVESRDALERKVGTTSTGYDQRIDQ